MVFLFGIIDFGCFAMFIFNIFVLLFVFRGNIFGGSVLSIDDVAMFVEFLVLRVVVVLVYGFVGVVGLLGNLVVLWVLGNCVRRVFFDIFVFNLVLVDLGMVFIFFFWVVELVLDFYWFFGGVFCKMVLTVIVFNVYVSIFFITALSVVRYWVVVMVIGLGIYLLFFWVRMVILVVWMVVVLVIVFTVVFGVESEVCGVRLCLMRFFSKYWLGVY